MIDIFFIRHGATEGNLRRRYIGRTDEPLCEAGIAQVKALQKRGLSVDRLFGQPHAAHAADGGHSFSEDALYRRGRLD